jgi:uncharacterized protein YcfJ
MNSAAAKESPMKKAILVSALGAIGLATAGAASAEEVGRVISSTPVVQQVAVPRQVCNQTVAQVQEPAPTSGGGAVLGAIVGGLLGHTVGGGMGRAAATGVGVVAGAAVGNNLEQRDTQYASRPVTQCTTQTAYENRTVGYNVQYEYAGKTYNVQMPYDPGPTIRLNIQPATSSAAPAEGVQTVSATQPVYVADTPSAVYPAYAYPAYGYPAYYRPYPYWYPPVSFSLGYVYHGGGHWHH